MNDQHTTEDDAAVASFHDDPLEVVRVIAGLAAQYASMTDDERRGQPSPVRPDSPMALAAKRICLLNGYAENGDELPGFMERAALRELEANPTREMRALDEAMSLAAPNERDAVLEEAALICDGLHHSWRWDDAPDSDSGPRSCAASIRALKGAAS